MQAFFTILLLGALILFSTLGAANAQSLRRIRIGYPSLSFRQSHLWVAKEEGLFRKQ